MARKVNWEKIKTEYITGDISQKKIAKKYGVPFGTLQSRAQSQHWFDARKKHQEKVISKSLRKAEEKQVRIATKELTLLDKIEQHLDRAISDVDQFNRYIVTEQVGHGMTETSEQMYSKADMKALKDAMQTLAMIEKMKQERLDRANSASNEMRVKFVDGSNEEWGD